MHDFLHAGGSHMWVLRIGVLEKRPFHRGVVSGSAEEQHAEAKDLCMISEWKERREGRRESEWVLYTHYFKGRRINWEEFIFADSTIFRLSRQV